MPADTFLILLLAGLAAAALPLAAWIRALKRIRNLEMTLLAQATDVDRYEELRALLQQVAAQTEQLANIQAQLARRLTDRELPSPRRSDPERLVTPH